MEILHDIKENYAILKLKGHLDLPASGLLETEVNTLISNSTKNVLLDFSGVEFINSAGLRGIFISSNKLKASGGKLILYSLHNQVKEIFTITGFDKALTIATSQEEAEANLS
ncbi:MAG: STAS domain-containing protein [Ignavibacteriaceae bacterium]|nr:STAS domain-containing protein [Ignavibacteriaceae bacterium]HRI46564.1 STAS domain-containing protein [Ignavibacteriaceae bacterium]